jgi:hypothetical protein
MHVVSVYADTPNGISLEETGGNEGKNSFLFCRIHWTGDNVVPHHRKTPESHPLKPLRKPLQDHIATRGTHEHHKQEKGREPNCSRSPSTFCGGESALFPHGTALFFGDVTP